MVKPKIIIFLNVDLEQIIDDDEYVAGYIEGYANDRKYKFLMKMKVEMHFL